MTGDLLTGVLAKAVRLGRMTAEDAADLAAVFAQVASRQARDTLFATRRQVMHPRRMAQRARRRARG